MSVKTLNRYMLPNLLASYVAYERMRDGHRMLCAHLSCYRGNGLSCFQSGFDFFYDLFIQNRAALSGAARYQFGITARPVPVALLDKAVFGRMFLVLFWRQVFKIAHSVIAGVAVFMIHLFTFGAWANEGESDENVNRFASPYGFKAKGDLRVGCTKVLFKNLAGCGSARGEQSAHSAQIAYLIRGLVFDNGFPDFALKFFGCESRMVVKHGLIASPFRLCLEPVRSDHFTGSRLLYHALQLPDRSKQELAHASI